MFSSTIRDVLSTAAAKAFATNGIAGINVVPVSMIRVNDDTIWLFDFFMDKTVQNLDVKAPVALTAWTDMKGIQIKAGAQYVTEGVEFMEAVAWVKEQNPARVVKGLIILTPTKIHDISPGGAFLENDLSI
jgi:predicted pyridoxine 5'-phosphate oxidase superfamily flavin-nucleotide-binding protein